MSIIGHYDVLLGRHSNLEEEIAVARQNHLSDEIITELKKKKLKLKEEILALEEKYNEQPQLISVSA